MVTYSYKVKIRKVKIPKKSDFGGDLLEWGMEEEVALFCFISLKLSQKAAVFLHSPFEDLM